MPSFNLVGPLLTSKVTVSVLIIACHWFPNPKFAVIKNSVSTYYLWLGCTSALAHVYASWSPVNYIHCSLSLHLHTYTHAHTHVCVHTYTTESKAITISLPFFVIGPSLNLVNNATMRNSFKIPRPDTFVHVYIHIQLLCRFDGCCLATKFFEVD